MRFVRLRNYLRTFDTMPIQAVAYEEVRRHMGVDAAHIYGGVVAAVTAWCEERKLPYMGIPVKTIKKLATGTGNADKQAMIDAARKRWPELQITMDDNEADARWIAEAAAKELLK